MSKEAQPHGVVEKLGEGAVEFVNLNIDLDDEALQQLKTDPHGVVQRFLESKGYKVNAVLLHDRSPEAIGGSARRWAHIFRPPHEASKWIQLPPDIM
jgi:hypothetical protein